MDKDTTLLFEKCAKEIDMDRTMGIVNWLTINTPHRVSGMGQDRVAAEYICDMLTSYGCDEAKVLEFETYNSRPGTSEFILLEPEHRKLESLPCCHIEPTPLEGAEYEVVYVGSGGEDDYLGKDVVGKAVLVEVSYAPATPEKAVIAARNGAVVMICMNWGPSDRSEICMRGLKGVWGNPTPETYEKIPKIVGCGISRGDGEYLKELYQKGETVKVFLKITAERLWETLPQPMAVIRGKEEPEKFLLISAHLEAWEPGATDNATGDATQMEIARILAKHKDELKRSVVFNFWNGHEIAEATGSTWYADYFWDELNENCIGYFNIDSTGMIDTEVYQADASRELKDFAVKTGELALKEKVRYSVLGKIGDQSFFGLGIPSIFGHMCFSEQELERTHGATFGWWNHTVQDGLDKVSVEKLEKDNLTQLAYAIGILNSKILPYNFELTAKDIDEKLYGFIQDAGEIIDLSVMKSQTEKLISNVAKLNALIAVELEKNDNEAFCKKINTVLLKLSRTLTGPFYSGVGRYEQDSYGSSILTKAIPLLHPLREMVGMDKTSLEYRLLYTKMLRNRNYLTDSLRSANEHIASLF